MRKTPSDKLREDLLSRLGDLEALSGNLLEAKGLLTESLAIARRLEANIAPNLMSLAMVAKGEGQFSEAIRIYDEAATLYMAEYQKGDAKSEKEAMRGLGGCLTNKPLVQKQQSDLVGAFSSLEQAISWFRKAESKDDLMGALFLLAEAQFADAKWQEGEDCLREAQDIAILLHDHDAEAQCLDLSGRLQFTLGRKEKALKTFEAALALKRTTGKPHQVVSALAKVARLYAENRLNDQAKALLNEAKELSLKHDLMEDYADNLLDLAEFEEGDGAQQARHDAIKKAIPILEREVRRTQIQANRGFLMGRVGSLYQRLEEHDEALNWFHRARDVFKAIGDEHGLANCLGSEGVLQLNACPQ